jgi:hypothetical protein
VVLWSRAKLEASQMMTKQAEAHGEPVALLRPTAVRELAVLLRPLAVRDRTTILAQAVHEGAMTRVGADQVLFALAFDGTGLSAGDTCGVAPSLDEKRSATSHAGRSCRSAMLWSRGRGAW